jgi:hypothetical protein
LNGPIAIEGGYASADSPQMAARVGSLENGAAVRNVQLARERPITR